MNIKILFIPLVLLSLVGCKEPAQDSDIIKKWKHEKSLQEGTARHKAELEMKKTINEANLLSTERLAKEAGKQAQIMADKLYQFAEPLVMFLSIVGAIVWVLWSFLRWFWKWQESNLVKEFRIKEVEEIERTKRSTQTHLIEHILKPEIFKLLSNDQKKMIIGGVADKQKLLESPEIKGALS